MYFWEPGKCNQQKERVKKLGSDSPSHPWSRGHPSAQAGREDPRHRDRMTLQTHWGPEPDKKTSSFDGQGDGEQNGEELFFKETKRKEGLVDCN